MQNLECRRQEELVCERLQSYSAEHFNDLENEKTQSLVADSHQMDICITK